ncbi:MAG: VCBS repeat-containing protein [Verrucomicrobiales bacterium]
MLQPIIPIAEDPGLGSLSLQSDALQFHRRLADELSNVDPSSAGWESEAFSEFVSSEMKHAVAEYLEHPSAADPDLIAALVSEGFACSSLRAEKLTTLMNEHEISVDEGSVATSDRKYLDAKGFMEALSLLLQPFGAATEVYAKFKVMHVEKQESQILTRLLFEMSGKQPVGRVQVTAVWHCMWTVESPWRLKSIDVTNYREVTPGIGRIEFADIAPAVLSKTSSYGEQLSKSFDYWRARSDRSLVADLLGAQGIAVGDVNGDLLDDIYVLQPGGLPNRLFIHQSDGSAIDYSVESGVDILDFCRSALFVDFDNDGDQDLAVGLAWTLVVFENNGHGHFIKRGEFPSDGQINSMAAADYDLDGRVDLYLCGRDASGEIKSEQGALGIPMPYYDANNGGPNTLLRNEGEFGFADVTESAGMNVNNRRFSLACAWEDFDNDGDQDLYVSNDFGRNNLFRNDGNGTFTDVAEAAGVVDVGPGMSAAWGDYNNDGLMDLYVGNMWSNAGNRITLQQQFLPGADQSARNQARRHARGNSVYLNSGDGSFRDLTQQSGANMARWAWSSKFTDLNNDGRQDLIVANGMITTEDSGDL